MASSPEVTASGGDRRVVVVDHEDSYTWNLVHLIAAVTGELPAVRPWWDPVERSEFSHVVLSPGPGHPREYHWGFVDGQSVFGVCLGMQGIVTAFGGLVERIHPAHGEVESVAHDVKGVFAGLPSPLDAVRYHSLAVTRLPDELEPTAWAVDGTLMGVRHRSLPIEGVQFHPESILSEYGAELIANFLR